ncbi:MAG: VCBS repeat-containing protein, partial [Planctomycetaceae bacterium]|nr:VCBS repeat-containing protein [Planctomycetaceae bacterium]
YDVDGDGLSDVITSLQAHGYGLVWYRQTKDGDARKFTANKILGATAEENPYGVTFSQLHAIDLVDMNGDGLKDIITGKRYWAHGPKGDAEPNAPAVVYWFELKRTASGKVDWVPHFIDDDSGVGTQVMAGDISGDGRPDVVVGNKKGIFAHIQESSGK